MKRAISVLAFTLYCLTAFCQARRELNVDYMLRGYICAASSIVDSGASGGFAESNNVAKLIGNSQRFTGKGFFMVLDTTRKATFKGEFKGYTLYIINKTNTPVKLNASDSRLDVIAEAFVDNKWQPIEYLPNSWCGNSYHHVYLKSKEYWEFTIPKYSGKINVNIRYKLILSKDAILYSNEIAGGINKNQLSKKQGHNPKGLMDPYKD